MNAINNQVRSACYDKNNQLNLRAEKFKVAERAFQELPLEERARFHQEQHFLSLIGEVERIRLWRMFPGEVSIKPIFLLSDVQKLVWDQKARLYLARFVNFQKEVKKRRLQLVSSVDSEDKVNIFAITSNGSYLFLGAPDKEENRKFNYVPLYSGASSYLSESGKGFESLQISKKGTIGRFQVSEIVSLAIGDSLGSGDKDWIDFVKRSRIVKKDVQLTFAAGV